VSVLAASFAVPIGAAWAALVAAPVIGHARRAVPSARALTLGRAQVPRGRVSRPTWAGSLDAAATRLWTRLQATVVMRVVTSPQCRRRAARDDAALAQELPVAVDLLGVAVGAGCTPYLAVESAARWAPPVVGRELAAVVQSCRLGSTFAAALRDLAARRPRLAPLVDALLVSERSGAPVAPALSRLADEERATLRRRAEAHARRVPVRLLFPLAFLVLPAFVLLTVVPGLVAGLARL
jgi:hypothetical protein